MPTCREFFEGRTCVKMIVKLQTVHQILPSACPAARTPTGSRDTNWCTCPILLLSVSPSIAIRPFLDSCAFYCYTMLRFSLYVGLARTIYIYIYTMYIPYFWQGITKFTVKHGVYIRFWPTLIVWQAGQSSKWCLGARGIPRCVKLARNEHYIIHNLQLWELLAKDATTNTTFNFENYF